MDQEMIVAEIAKNWLGVDDRESGLLAERFEHVIEVNRGRGYQLHSWCMHAVLNRGDEMVETIVAVFKKETP